MRELVNISLKGGEITFIAVTKFSVKLTDEKQ